MGLSGSSRSDVQAGLSVESELSPNAIAPVDYMRRMCINLCVLPVSFVGWASVALIALAVFLRENGKQVLAFFSLKLRYVCAESTRISLERTLMVSGS